MHKKRKVIIISGLAVVLLLAVILLTVFRIRKITVAGTERYTAEEMERLVLSDVMDYNTIWLWLKTKLGPQIEIPFVEKYDIRITGASSVEITVYEKSVVGYINCMGANMFFDKDGIIVETTGDSEPAGAPLVTGLRFDYAVLHEKIPVDNKSTFELLLNLTQQLIKDEISVEKIYLSGNMEITLFMGNVRVELGKDEKMAEKLNDLKNLQENLKQYSGVLDMKEYNESGTGYTLKRDDYVEPESKKPEK